MTPPTSREGLPVMTEQLKPCPFCGNELYRSPRAHNPKAYCVTEDCYGKRMSVVNLDDPIIVAMWNTRQAVNSYPEMREALSEALAYIECDTDQREADRLIAKIKTALGENEMSDPWELTKKVRDYGYQLLNEAEHSKAVGAKDAQFAATAGAAVIENVLRIIKDYFHDRG